MLTAIKASLIDANNASDEASDRVLDKTTMRWQNKKFLNIHPDIMTTVLQAVCGISVATAYRILASLVEEDMYTKYRENGHWAYKLK